MRKSKILTCLPFQFDFFFFPSSSDQAFALLLDVNTFSVLLAQEDFPAFWTTCELGTRNPEIIWDFFCSALNLALKKSKQISSPDFKFCNSDEIWYFTPCGEKKKIYIYPGWGEFLGWSCEFLPLFAEFALPLLGTVDCRHHPWGGFFPGIAAFQRFLVAPPCPARSGRCHDGEMDVNTSWKRQNSFGNAEGGGMGEKRGLRFPELT